MMTKKEFGHKVDGMRRIYGAIQEAQMQAIANGEYEFSVIFGKDDREIIHQIGYKLGFYINECEINDKIQFTFE